MFIKVNSATHSGLRSTGVEVEINISKKGLPKFEIVGLPAKSVDESAERVRTAINNSGINLPARRIVINLAPADIPKEGSFYDLPIGVGIIALLNEFEIPDRSLFFGELSLDGSLRHTKGALLFSLFARQAGFENLFLPKSCANEAAIIKGVNVYPVESLEQMTGFLAGNLKIEKKEYQQDISKAISPEFDMKEVLGQEQAKRAAEIAAAGAHNMFMMGSPGCGKTMIARALPGILPSLNEEESLEVTKIYSVTGKIPPGGSLIKTRPFRSPHHSISSVGLIGGGTRPQPGEVTLAHRGVLFLDEFNEFPRKALESLRQPMEDGNLTIARSRERATYPAKFMLVAASNPCPCGYLEHPEKECRCTQRQIKRYRGRISGPVLDRIDIQIKVPYVNIRKVSQQKKKSNLESSKSIRERVVKARKVQKQRFKNEDIFTNSEMKNKQIERYCSLSNKAEQILIQASNKYGLSARSYFRVIKVARTIADLESSKEIKLPHITEALQYRVSMNE